MARIKEEKKAFAVLTAYAGDRSHVLQKTYKKYSHEQRSSIGYEAYVEPTWVLDYDSDPMSAVNKTIQRDKERKEYNDPQA
jgi:hypothetical protein